MYRNVVPSAVNELATFGFSVRHRREALGFSQESLADRAGLHRTYVGDVERGRRNLGLRNVFVLAHALGLSVHDLLAEADRMRTDKRVSGLPVPSQF